MKTNSSLLTLCAVFGAAVGATAAPVLIPNGDFEATPPSADWGQAFEGAQVITYEETGGNPDGFAQIVSNEGGGYAVLISNNNAPYPLASLGLVAGETYTFSYDMISSGIGANKGGIKLESWTASAIISNSGDQRATTTSTDWTTYTYDYTIDPAATHIKVVPLWTPNETVGFDNIKVDNTPVEPPPFVPDQIPNGDFEIPGGVNWSYFTDGFGLDYPTTGGNPGGNAIIDGTTGGGYGVLVAFDNAEKPAASLGLTPGGPCKIQMDMKLISGVNVGGLKLEGPEGFVAIIEPAPLAGLGTWATYTFEFTLQNGLNPVTQFKIVPLGRSGSVVAYDNIKIILPTPPGPLQATIAQGTAVSWAPPSAINAYQPQKSPDGISWTDLGPRNVGNTVTSVFDGTKSAFYRVMESVPALEEATYNGGFEEEGFDEFEAFGWESPPTQLAERTTADARTGLASMRIKAVNGTPFVAPPAESQTSQNTVNANLDGGGTGTITVGNTYTLSFWAKQISFGPSYVQEYRVSWLNEIGAEIQIGVWQPFAATVGGTWEQKTLSGLVAPEGATTAFIQIAGKLGGVDGAEGEVLIDDVTLMSDGFGSPTELNPGPSIADAVEISWPSKTGQDYQVRSSTNLNNWGNFGGVISGDNSTKSVFDIISGPSKFYQVGELP